VRRPFSQGTHIRESGRARGGRHPHRRAGRVPADHTPYRNLQPVNPLRASCKAMDKVSGDMYGALMQGVGVLMQTKGLSGIIGGLMNAA